MTEPSDKYKTRSDREFAELDYDTRHGFWYAAKWVGACIVAIVAVVAVLWGVGVLWAGPKGAGDAHKTNESGTNRIAKQEWFEQTYADIQVADQRVGMFAEVLKTEPRDVVARTNYQGAVNHCNQLVANYNAEARKYTSADWRDNELPERIDQTDPKFDCKESDK
jgi:hypothetical protein